MAPQSRALSFVGRRGSPRDSSLVWHPELLAAPPAPSRTFFTTANPGSLAGGLLSLAASPYGICALDSEARSGLQSPGRAASHSPGTGGLPSPSGPRSPGCVGEGGLGVGQENSALRALSSAVASLENWRSSKKPRQGLGL